MPGTCHTFPHVSCQGLVIRTGTGVFRRVLVDHWGREAQKLTTSIHTVALSAPVAAYQAERGVMKEKALGKLTHFLFICCFVLLWHY